MRTSPGGGPRHAANRTGRLLRSGRRRLFLSLLVTFALVAVGVALAIAKFDLAQTAEGGSATASAEVRRTVELAVLLLLGVGGAVLSVQTARRMEGAYLLEATDRDRAEALHRLGSDLGLASEPIEVLEIAVAELHRSFGALQQTVWLAQDVREALPADRLAALELTEVEAPTPLQEHGLAIADIATSPLGEVNGDPASGNRWVVSASLPLLVGRRRLGSIQLNWKQRRALPLDDLAQLRSIGRQTGVSLERAVRHRRDALERARAQDLQRALATVAQSFTRQELLLAVAQECIPALGAVDGGIILLPDAEGPPAPDSFEADSEPLPTDPRLLGPVEQAVQGRSVLVIEGDELLARHPDAWQAVREAKAKALAVCPVLAGDHPVGALVAMFDQPEDVDARWLVTFTALALQLGDALERATRVDKVHSIARTLQHSMLDLELPQHPEVALTAIYTAAADEMEVGGDWYDAVVWDDGRITVLIGDLVGHGLPAAAAMGQLRSAARALAPGLEPAELLDRLDTFAATTPECFMSTAAVAVVDPASDKLTYACAGHPFPILRSGTGSVRTLSGATSPPLGMAMDGPRPQDHLEFPEGSSLLLYTDGLVERRDEPLDTRLARLTGYLKLSGSPAGRPWLQDLLDELDASQADDDVAVVLIDHRGAVNVHQ